MFGNLTIDVNYNTSISNSFREISILRDNYFRDNSGTAICRATFSKNAAVNGQLHDWSQNIVFRTLSKVF